jgi:hypothetical protein
MRNTLLVITPICLAAIGSQSHAATVFFDDFNAENAGVGVLNYNGFANWNVTRQSVDLIGNGFFDFLPGNGLYVDLDGSTGSAGEITSMNLNLAAGSYQFSFDLAGSQRGEAPFNTVELGLEIGVLSDTIMLASADPFATYTYYFTLNAATTVNIVFDHQGGDNIGLLLDNVHLQTIPTPLASLIAGAGLFGVIGVRRRAAV